MFQAVALSLLCAMSLVQLLFVENILDAFVVLLPDNFYPLVTVTVAPMTTGATKLFIFNIIIIIIIIIIIVISSSSSSSSSSF
jgi:hypothetical protein